MTNEDEDWFLSPDDEPPTILSEVILFIILIAVATFVAFRRDAALWIVTIALAVLFCYAFWRAL